MWARHPRLCLPPPWTAGAHAPDTAWPCGVLSRWLLCRVGRRAGHAGHTQERLAGCPRRLSRAWSSFSRTIEGMGGPRLPTAGGSRARRPHAWPAPLWTLVLQPARDRILETLRGCVSDSVSTWRAATGVGPGGAAGHDSLSVTLGETTRGQVPWGAAPVGLTVL